MRGLRGWPGSSVTGWCREEPGCTRALTIPFVAAQVSFFSFILTLCSHFSFSRYLYQKMGKGDGKIIIPFFKKDRNSLENLLKGLTVREKIADEQRPLK